MESVSRSLALLWAAAALLGCVGSGELTTRVSGQIVGEDEKPIGPGLVLLERGPVHQGTYQFGAVIGVDGRFTLEIPSGGLFGIHLFHNDYQYLPAEFRMDTHQQIVITSPMVAWGDWMDRSGMPTWPNQPADPVLVRMPVDDNVKDNPTLRDITMTWTSPELLEISAVAEDPDNDLSRMILTHNTATGAGLALNPPGPPTPEGLYPNGKYTLKVFRDPRDRPGESVWYFVVSDNNCNNSPIYQRILPPLP